MSIEHNYQEPIDFIPVSCVQFNLNDPTDKITNKNDYQRIGYPKKKAIVTATLSRDYNEILNDHSKPTSELINDAIIEIAIDSEARILSQKHCDETDDGLYTEFNCANCGNGLGLDRCSCCGHTFRDDKYRFGWSTPLSTQMAEFLEKKVLILE